jgi:hypothetical protein
MGRAHSKPFGPGGHTHSQQHTPLLTPHAWILALVVHRDPTAHVEAVAALWLCTAPLRLNNLARGHACHAPVSKATSC